MGNGRSRIGLVTLGLLCFGSFNQAGAAGDQYLTVTIGPQETIRDVAERYLADPDLWPVILRTSGIPSVADVKAGTELKIPVTEVSSANSALSQSLTQIQKANAAGAQIFAPDEIGKAVDLNEQALRARLEAEWLMTHDLAVASYEQATTAITKSESQRDQAAEALVSDRSGQVEGQRPEDLSWRGLEARSVLIEEEKVRTLSDSTAQITFRDASRLRLSSNSNAVITQMRFDPLSHTEEAKVTLVQGDFYALLGGDNERKKFNVEIPDVNANIDSGNFWVSNSGGSAKFANYDDKPVSVAANGETVTLGLNQGTIVNSGEKPTDAQAVLPPPVPSAPTNEGPVYVGTPELAWSPVAQSAGYWVELSSDQSFEHIVENQFGIEDAKLVVAPLAAGEYFWRVSALDGFGLPGARSPIWSFRVTPDDTPPYLTIEKPAAGVILREASVEVSGESEAGASVTVNGKPVELSQAGTFATTLVPAAGDNAIEIVAIDPAGNKTTASRHFVYMPDQQSVVTFDASIRQIGPVHFLTNSDVISLGGKTTENATIEVRSGDAVRASAVADAAGAFQINVPLVADEERLTFAVIAPSGFTTTEEITITSDRVAPEIALDDVLPRLTAEAGLRVSGTTEADAEFAISGKKVALRDGHFDETITLAPGENVIELTATDAVGNVSVEKSSVKLDQEPPQLISAKATPATNGGSDVLSLEVVAADASGLAKAAPFTVVAGANSYTGYLRYNKATKTYQGTVVVPDAELTVAKLGQVELQDDAGNSKSFDIR